MGKSAKKKASGWMGSGTVQTVLRFLLKMSKWKADTRNCQRLCCRKISTAASNACATVDTFCMLCYTHKQALSVRNVARLL